MYPSLLQRFQVFSQSINFIEHHKLAIILGVIAVLCLVYVLSIPVDHQMFTQQSSARALSARSADIAKPLTRLDDPHYVHEHDIRAHYIIKNLERLRNKTGADRAYVVSYGYGSARFGNRIKKIASTFEVSPEGLTPQLMDYQDLSRMNWLHIKRDEKFFSVFLPLCYGMELYNEDDVAIGYIGIEYLKKGPAFQSSKLKLLPQAAALIEAGFLQSLKHLNSLESL
jgi:hypothetical protein